MAEKVALISLGCPKNLVDSEMMLGHLQTDGYELTTDAAEADVIVVNTCGFLGWLFTNMVIFNPTFPVRRADGAFFEAGCPPTSASCTPTAQDVRNPVALAEQIQDVAPETRLLGNLNATVQLLETLAAQTTLGVDNTDAERQTYAPRSSAVGAAFGGYARQAQRSLQNLNFQQPIIGILTSGFATFQKLITTPTNSTACPRWNVPAVFSRRAGVPMMGGFGSPPPMAWLRSIRPKPFPIRFHQPSSSRKCSWTVNR